MKKLTVIMLVLAVVLAFAVSCKKQAAAPAANTVTKGAEA